MFCWWKIWSLIWTLILSKKYDENYDKHVFYTKVIYQYQQTWDEFLFNCDMNLIDSFMNYVENVIDHDKSNQKPDFVILAFIFIFLTNQYHRKDWITRHKIFEQFDFYQLMIDSFYYCYILKERAE